MAGYDFSLKVPRRQQVILREALQTVRQHMHLRDLEFTFRTKRLNGTIEVYCKVDGGLDEMQVADEQLPQFIDGHYRSLKVRIGAARARQVLAEVLLPLIEANAKGVRMITGAIFELADLAGGVATSLARDHRLTEATRRHLVPRCLRDAARTFDEALRDYRVRRRQPKDALIAFDHSFEIALKEACAIPRRPRCDYPQVLEKAVQSGVLTKREAYRLRLFHRARNRCQHEGRPAYSRTVTRFAEYGRDIMRRLLGVRPKVRRRASTKEKARP